MLDFISLFVVLSWFPNWGQYIYSIVGEFMLDKNYLKQKLVIISFIGLIFIIIGNFLPLIEISSKAIEYKKTFSFIPYEGKYILVLAIISCILLLLKEPKTIIFPMLVVSILLGYLLLHKSSIYTACDSFKDMFSWGIGLYILIVGNILAYVAPIGTFLSEKLNFKITRKL